MTRSAREKGYDLFEHRHRFAVWAAARASQRGFTSVGVLRSALASTDIAEFVSHRKSLRTTAKTFEIQHRVWCAAILQFLRRRAVARASYGRAAKLVAVYLKAMTVVGPDSGSALSAVVHPPIDRILLKNLLSSEIGASHLSQWRNTAWTGLDMRSYYALVSDLRAILPPSEPFWKLERYWTVT